MRALANILDDKIYIVKDNEFRMIELFGSKIDGHCHSKYSNEYIQTSITNAIGVQESNTKIKTLYKRLKKRGMDFFTVSDHDSILGALELRAKHPDQSFVSCEYTIPLKPFDGEQTIHMNCWGMDYADNSSYPLSDHDLLQLHNRLLKEARKGYKSFVQYCRKRDICIAFNHPAWQSNSAKLINGEQFDEIVNFMAKHRVPIEVNGDIQLENLIAIEVAEMFNLPICSGTDAHTSKRLGNQYTVVWKEDEQGNKLPVETPHEFIQAFKNENMGIGSRFSLPDDMIDPSQRDIVKHQFNGSILNCQWDTLYGIGSYLSPVSYWNPRKLAFITGAFLLPIGLSILFGPEWPASLFGSLEAAIFSTVPVGLPIRERLEAAKFTRKLYSEWKLRLAYKEAGPLRDKRESIVSEIKGIQKRIMEMREEISENKNSIDAINDEIDIIRASYEQLSHLPKLNPEIKGWNRIAAGLMDKLAWVFHGKGPKNISQFTRPVKKDDEQ